MADELTDHQKQDASAREARAVFFDKQTGAFFRRVDWSAFWTVWIIAFSLYLFTLAPSVTLEDSGEESVAADYMGVPHPPGYPLWTLLAWSFQWVFHGIKYHGYPNPAWAIGLMSAVCASLACAILALLVSRSGTDMMRGMKRQTDVLGLATESKICWTAGVSAGLLLAFSPVLWSQAVIVEVYALNCFFMITLLMLIYRWMSRPEENASFFAIAYVFGLGLTNHHTLFFLSPAVLFAMAFRDRSLFRDALAILSLALSGLLFYRAYTAEAPVPPAPAGMDYTYLFAFLFLLAPVGLFLYHKRLFTEWKRVIIAGCMVALGLSFYLFMPIASEQNPPHNWGYTRTFEGFMHSFTRGQYERITPSDVFGNPEQFFDQMQTYFRSLRAQFTLPAVLMAILPFFFLTQVHRRTRTWLITLLSAFFFVSIMLVIFLNPTPDIQTLFIQRRFLILSHAVFAVWLGYSIIFALSMLEMRLARIPLYATLKYAVLALAFVFPLTILYRNFYYEPQIAIIGGPEQRGHDFGWQFGHWQLRGAKAIKEDLYRKYGPEKFEEIWAEFPNPDYPPEIEQDAIFFGGTDPGRFVPTYMIFSARCRPDVFLITQNALADNTYMAVMRDLYGDRIWIPSQADSNEAFQRYVQDVQAGRIPPGADVVVRDGRVSVQGVAGVMMINGILCQMIFEQNKHKHPFYVEESYVIQWMYPYLEPHGLILRLHPEPIELSAETIANDRAFWDWYTAKLLGNPRFLRDIVARKTFSKLRSAIAGIYVFRRNYEEAEHAFKQAIDLYPLSPEASFRMADMYMQLRRLGEAREVIAALLEGDPGNERVAQFHEQISQMENMDLRRQALEVEFQEGPGNLDAALELVELYMHLQMWQQFQGLALSILRDDQVPVDTYLRVSQYFANAQRLDLVELAFKRYLEREPRNPRVWVDLAALHVARQKQADFVQALRRAVELGGEPVRDAVRKDQRFDSVRHLREYQQLVPAATQQQRPTGMSLPFQF